MGYEKDNVKCILSLISKIISLEKINMLNYGDGKIIDTVNLHVSVCIVFRKSQKMNIINTISFAIDKHIFSECSAGRGQPNGSGSDQVSGRNLKNPRHRQGKGLT